MYSLFNLPKHLKFHERLGAGVKLRFLTFLMLKCGFGNSLEAY